MIGRSSIGQKLIALTLGVSSGVLILAAAAFYIFEIKALKEQKIADLLVLGETEANSLVASLLFDDKKSAEEVLRSLRANQQIKAAFLLKENGEVFAEFQSSGGYVGPVPDFSAERSTDWSQEQALVSQPIFVDSDLIGSLSIISSNSDVSTRMRNLLKVALLILAGAFILAWLITSRLQRVISKPILDLAELTRNLTACRDYSVRATLSSRDEIGALITGFNQMLAEIEKRDIQLQSAHDELELRVSDRTQKLMAEISEREKIELALRREHEQLRDLIRTAPVAMAMLDMNMCYLAHSDRWLSDYGLGETNITGRSHYQIFPQIPERWRAIHQRALAGERERSSEDSFEIEPGRLMYLSWTVQPWYKPNREQGGVMMASTDITELVTARERALQIAEMKSNFLANMSHELRTPLNAIIGYSELLSDYDISVGEQRAYTETIKSSGALLLSLINDILDFSKIESRKMTLESRPFSPRQSAEKLVAILTLSAQQKGIFLDLKCADHLPALVLGDQLRTEQILMNLISNAIKFTQRGGVTVSIRPSLADSAHSLVKFDISDTGIGLGKDKIENVFKAFTQADGSTTRRFGGTGLGLAISSKLVELMNGTIEVESIEGEGSVFSVTLSYQTVTENQGLESMESRSKEIETKSPFDSELCILVAEDNEVNQKLISAILKKQGYLVTVAKNGEDAFKRIQSGEFDLVLMDLQMPVMDGIEATMRIRALEGRKASVPIVALTAHAFLEDQERCRLAGMNGYLTKPIDRAKLLDTLAGFKRAKESGA